MCGIVAYIGPREAYPVIMKGLKRLEYRGYDSAGVALLDNNNLRVYKKQGRVAALEESIIGKDLHAHAASAIPDGQHTANPATVTHILIFLPTENWP